jgi:hypothetical protein
LTSTLEARRRRNPWPTTAPSPSSPEDEPSLYDSVAILALLATVDGGPAHLRDKVCRYYSTTFSTPLREVRQMDFVEVLREYYAHHFDRLSETEQGRETLLDTARALVRPDLVVEDREEEERFAQEAVVEDEDRKASGEDFMAYLRRKQRQSSKTLTKDFRVVKKKAAEPPPRKEAESSERKVTFDEVDPGIASGEVSDDGLEDLFNE